MNEIITNGTEIKQKIISEIQKATENIYIAMAFFTDRDIASAIISSRGRNVSVEIILSSNAQNETVKQMLRDANIDVHAFEAGDERGMMHHKFCLIDNEISINGSYNYSYNASNNNVENIHVSNDPNTYQQLLSEFKRLKYNIEHHIDVNINSANPMTQVITTEPIATKPINISESFTQQLSNLVYTTANIDTESYKERGYNNSKESSGSLQVFKANFDEIKERIRTYATDESLAGIRNTLIQNVNAAFEGKKSEIKLNEESEINKVIRNNELTFSQLRDKINELNQTKAKLESGNSNSGEKGLLQINGEIEKLKLEKRNLESSFIVKKFWNVGTVLGIIGLMVFIYYLSVFFASAIFKVFFEGNIIRNTLEAGMTPDLPQLVDANAIIKIFRTQGTLFGIMAGLFFLVPLLLSNLKLLGSKKKWVNILCFCIGLLIFDILVATMVAINTDEIKSLLIGKESHLKLWEVVEHGEFWLIFVFGMLPLLITHYIIEFIVESYKKSKREIMDAEKNKKIQIIDHDLITLNTERDIITSKINDIDATLKVRNDDKHRLEIELNNQKNLIQNKYVDLMKELRVTFDNFIAKITSGRVFTDEIFDSVSAAYKSGFVGYLPEYYAEREVAARVKEIGQIINNN